MVKICQKVDKQGRKSEKPKVKDSYICLCEQAFSSFTPGFFERQWLQNHRWIFKFETLSWMHTTCVLCVSWAHASDFVTSRPFVMRLIWSASSKSESEQ